MKIIVFWQKASVNRPVADLQRAGDLDESPLQAEQRSILTQDFIIKDSRIKLDCDGYSDGFCGWNG
jgi:hypothetical protein